MVAPADCRRTGKGLSFGYDYAHFARGDLHIYLHPSPRRSQKSADLVLAAKPQKKTQAVQGRQNGAENRGYAQY